MAKEISRVKIFEYSEDMDAFRVSELYYEIAEDLGIVEWNPVVWIGRYFSLDNDFGEHWFDNFDMLEERRVQAEERGIAADELLVMDPMRFQDGRDGPCHSDEARSLFWRDVLSGLSLSLETIASEAYNVQALARARLQQDPGDLSANQLLIEDLDQRIARWASELGSV